MALHLLRFSRITGIAAITVGSQLISPAIPAAEGNVEWPAHGATSHSARYVALDQIDRQNVDALRIAWQWESVDEPLAEADPPVNVFSFQSTPIYVDGLLYTSTSASQVAALDPGTGETRWVYDPESYKAGRPLNWGYIHRGVAYWEDGADGRIFIGTGDGRLIALDAKTGKPCSDFGNNGMVDAIDGLSHKEFSIDSPPIICRDVVVIGSNMPDAAQETAISGGPTQGV